MMTNYTKLQTKGMSTDYLVSEVVFRAKYHEDCKYDYGRNDKQTLEAKEDLEWVIETIREKIAELEKYAAIGRTVEGLFKEVMK